jgi:hypothetical protein
VFNGTYESSVDASGYHVHRKAPSQLCGDYIPTRREALDMLPPMVYFVRMPDGIIKIGHSGNLGQRINALGGELLAFKPGDRADERSHHERFAHLLERGREWFRPGDDLLDYINELRSGLGLPVTEAA